MRIWKPWFVKKNKNAKDEEIIKNFNIKIKTKNDIVYDLFLDDEWIGSRGTVEDVLSEIEKVIRT